MPAPRFRLVQGVSGWSSGSVTEFSTTGGSGNTLGSLVGVLNYSSNIGPTGPRSDNSWSNSHPVAIGQRSYEFIFGLYLSSPADNSVNNMRVWVPPFTPIAGCTFYMGTAKPSAFSTPVSSASSKATINFTALNSPSSAYLDIGSPANVIGGLSDPIWTQVDTFPPAAGGPQGPMPQIVISIDWS